MNWITSIVLVFLHIGAVAALFMFTWRALAVTIFLYWMTIGLGISMGYHRLHTHRSYQVPRFLEYFFALCGSMTGRRTDLLGRYPSDSPPEIRPAGRSAFAA
jgi:stearoyl-CoA desaturase (delta-9 desaturase)